MLNVSAEGPVRFVGLKPARGSEGDGVGEGGVDEAGVEPALVGGEGRVVEAPVSEVVVGGVAVPVGGGEVEGELHPVPLSLVVAEFGCCALTRVGSDGDKRAEKEGSEGDKEGSGERRR